MVDSGNQITHGYEDFYNVYKAMVDIALARPAQADITATWQRVGDKVRFDVRLTNLSLVTLSSSSNSATVHAIVYEDAHVADTDRFVRATVSTDITSSLAPGATASFVLETADLSGVNWDKLHFIVLADYRPGGASGAYDMLQAAVALPPLTVQPDKITFMVDPADPLGQSASVTLQGPESENWMATTYTSWLTVTPSSGSMATHPTISVITNTISAGWQQGYITFTVAGGGGLPLADQVLVNAYYGSVKRVYLPVVLR